MYGANMAAEMTVNKKIKNVQANLRKKGWNINEEAIEECMQELEGKSDRTIDEVIKWALDCDLKDIGSKVLTEEVKRGQVQSVDGPVVVQIQKIRNISAPKANEESAAAPRLLKLQLTDGRITCFALEHSVIQKLSLSTPPGTKIRIKGTVPLLCGFMLLEPHHVEILGGKVEKLIMKWETNKNVTQQRVKPGVLSDDGPPLFIAFDSKTNSAVKTSGLKRSVDDYQKSQNSSSSEKSNSNQRKTNEENKKVHEAFEQTRGQRIQTAKQGNERQSNPTKVGNSTNKSTQVTGNQQRQLDTSSGRDQRRVGKEQELKSNNGPKYDSKHGRDTKLDKEDSQKSVEKSNYERKPGSRKGGRHNDDDCNEYSSSRPSTGTLWDFLETKLPANDGERENVEAKHLTVVNFQASENQNIQKVTNQRYGQSKNEHTNEKQYGGARFSADYNKHKNLHGNEQEYEQGNRVRHNKDDTKQRNQDNNQSRNQSRSEQKYEQNRYVDQQKRSQQKYNKDEEQSLDKRNDKHNNRRNDQPSRRSEHFDKRIKQPDNRYIDQNYKREQDGRHVNEEHKQKSSNYRKASQEYDETYNKKTENSGRTQNINISKRDARVEGKSQQQLSGDNAKQSIENIPKRDKEQANPNKRDHKVFSKNERKDMKKTVDNNLSASSVERSQKREGQAQGGSNKNRDVNERYEDDVIRGRGNDSRKQHWWKKGEECMAFQVEYGQYCLARVVKVEVPLRSCIVTFSESGRQETISWSNLFPLDVQKGDIHNFQRSHFSSVSSEHMQDKYIHQNPSNIPQFNQSRKATSGHYAAQDSVTRVRTAQRPTQAFYKPPRGTKD